TLPGHEPGAKRVGITHQDYVDSVVSYIKQHDLQDVILVGHSFGRSVISRVVEYLPDRLQRLIFLDGFFPADNQSVHEVLPTAFTDMLGQLAQASSDNTFMIPWEIWRNNLIQDAPLEVARLTWEHLSPEPYQVCLDKLDLKAFYSLDIPKSYIACRQD